jgi:hypothetical protein
VTDSEATAGRAVEMTSNATASVERDKTVMGASGSGCFGPVIWLTITPIMSTEFRSENRLLRKVPRGSSPVRYTARTETG